MALVGLVIAFNFVGIGPAAAVREHTDAYKRAWSAYRHDPERLNGHVATPKIGILRLVVVADRDTDEKRRRAPHRREGVVLGC